MDKAELDEYLAGLAIDDQGHIVAVDLVSPTVFRITENGELVKWFDCSDRMREPSDLAIHAKEFYICDFKVRGSYRHESKPITFRRLSATCALVAHQVALSCYLWDKVEYSIASFGSDVTSGDYFEYLKFLILIFFPNFKCRSSKKSMAAPPATRRLFWNL